MLNKAQLARLLGVTPARAGQLVDQGCPLTSEADARSWDDIRKLKNPGKFKNVPSPTRTEPPNETPIDEDEMSLDQMLRRLRMAEVRAAREVEQAAPGADAASALRAYNQAAKNRIECEIEIIKVQKELRMLLTPDQCEEVLARLRPVVSKMDTAAQSLGFKCNPSDPELAMGHISDYFEGLKAMFRDALGEGAEE